MNDWQVYISYIPGMDASAIFLRRKTSYGLTEYLKDGGSQLITHDGTKVIKDNEITFAYLDDDQLRALQTAIAGRGIKPPEASYTEGKLEATEKHLEDTRTLLSLNVPKLMPVEPVTKK